jgi:GNAT superfamily N-acetyltransferase
VNESPVAVELVAAQVVRPLRRAVLRPDHPVETSEYPADDDPSTAHAAVRLTKDTDVVAVGTVLRDPPPWEPGRRDGWRVRGMATSPDARRRGFGSLVLDALLRHVAAHGGGLVWCNARVPAQNLYAHAGFAPRGEVFDIAGIGPHVQMWRTLPSDR